MRISSTECRVLSLHLRGLQGNLQLAAVLADQIDETSVEDRLSFSKCTHFSKGLDNT